MSMNTFLIGILHLPDEILLTIFKKLDNTDLLFSLLGIDSRLDQVVCDMTFSRAVDLTTLLSDEENASTSRPVNDRIFTHILPRIRQNVESLTVQASYLPCILHTSNYPNLRKLTLVNLTIALASHIFSSTSLDFGYKA